MTKTYFQGIFNDLVKTSNVRAENVQHRFTTPSGPESLFIFSTLIFDVCSRGVLVCDCNDLILMNYDS